MPRLQFNEKLRVRQYIISDPSTIFYTEYYSSLKGFSSVDWQQQMRTCPTQYSTPDHKSDRLDLTNNSIRSLSSIPDLNPYYIDPAYGLNPYWDIQLYNQNALHFHNNFTKPIEDIEPECHATDATLNPCLSRALVDPWQMKINTCALPSQDEQAHQLHPTRQQVSLTTAVEARFVNTLVTRNGEPVYVLLTTNLGLKYKRRMLHFPMDFGELTLDGLVDTGPRS